MINGSSTNGQVLTTDASGNTSWVTPTVDTDNQKIDVYALNADKKNLDLSLEDDGEATKQVDLSGLAIAGDVTGTLGATTGNVANIEMTIEATSAAAVGFQFGSELSGGTNLITIQPNSYLEYQVLN